jgi:hypothetical protein
VALSAQFVADFSRWDASLKNAQAGLKSFEVPVRGVQQQLQRMANAFSGVEIRKQADLAVAAVKSIGGASRLTEAEQRKVNATVTEAIAKYDALGQKAPADLRKLQAETARVEKSTGLLGGTLTKLAGAFAAAFTISAIKTAITDTIAFAGTIQDLSAQTGFGVRALQELKFAAEQNGSSLESVTNAAFQLQKQLGTGGTGVTGSLKKLGLNLQELKSLRPEEQFTVVANKLGEVRNQSDRAAIGAQLMGKGFKDVAPLIAAGLDAQIAKAREYGLVLDEETIGALDNLGDAWGAVQLAGTAFIAKALVPLAPVITQALNALLPFAAKIAELPAFFTKAHGAILKFADAQTQATIKILEISKIVNPVSNAFGQIDKRIGDLRVQSFLLKNELVLLERGLKASGTAATTAAGAGGGGFAELDKAIASLRDKLSGASIRQELKELEQAWKALTPAQRQNEDVVKRTLAAYEKIRAELPRVGGALEDLRTAHLKALEPAQMHEQIFGRLATVVMPNAERMFRNGQSALDGLARSGALLSSRLVPIEVQMKAMPPLLKSSAVAATDWKRRQDEAAAASEAWRGRLADLVSALSSVAQIGGRFSGLARALSEVVGLAQVGAQAGLSLKKGWEQASGAFKQGHVDVAQLAGGLIELALAAQAAVAAMDAATDVAGRMNRTLRGAAVGAQIGGSIVPGWGHVIGAAVGALVGALRNPRWEQTIESVGDEFGASISRSLAEAIERSAKERFGGNRQAAKIFNLSAILEEAGGLSAANLRPMFARFRDLFSMIETGAFTAAEGLEVLDANFRTFADFVTKDGSLASRELLDIIKLTDQFGLKSAEVSAFVVQETNKALGGLTTFLKNVSVQTQASADGIGAALFGIFEAQTANGVPAAEVIRQLDPLIQQLDAQLKKAGLSGGAAFAHIQALAAVASHEIAGPLIDGVLGLDQALTGLHNSGVLTEEMFDGITASVADTYQQILATGVDGSRALQLIGPSLQTIWELQQDFGYSVDEATQALLDEAAAAGLVGDAHRTAQEQMLRLMDRQTDALEYIAQLFGYELPAAVDKFSDAIDQLPSDIEIDATVNFEIGEVPEFPDGVQPTGDVFPTGVPGYSTGTPGLGFVNFGRGRLAMLHDEEAVVPKDRAGEFAARHGGGESAQVAVSLSIQAWDGTDVMRVVKSRAFSDALVDQLLKNGYGTRTRVKAALQ